MKTPKELLLDRHRDAEPSLDCIRMEMYQALKGEGSGQALIAAPQCDSLLTMLWQELFMACRHYWVGLSAVWCVIAILAMAGGWSSGDSEGTATAPSEPVAQALLEQQKLRAELLGLATAPEDSRARQEEDPGPRSELTVLSKPA